MSQAPLLGGLFIGVLSALPVVGAVNVCCCLWVVGGGALAAYLDQQQDPRPTTPGRGAKNGLLAGLVGAVVWLVVSMLIDPLLGPLRERMLEEFLRAASDVPPEVREVLEEMRGGSGGGQIVVFLFLLPVWGIFATLGGVLGAAFFRTDVPPALGGPIEPPVNPQ